MLMKIKEMIQVQNIILQVRRNTELITLKKIQHVYRNDQQKKISPFRKIYSGQINSFVNI